MNAIDLRLFAPRFPAFQGVYGLAALVQGGISHVAAPADLSSLGEIDPVTRDDLKAAPDQPHGLRVILPHHVERPDQFPLFHSVFHN